ncbi:MAG: hypothetical protein KIS92_23380 [Planctomycetota bacterium]|nr:hypothetical protein [Planctomycetota bacterium]
MRHIAIACGIVCILGLSVLGCWISYENEWRRTRERPRGLTDGMKMVLYFMGASILLQLNQVYSAPFFIGLLLAAPFLLRRETEHAEPAGGPVYRRWRLVFGLGELLMVSFLAAGLLFVFFSFPEVWSF